MAIKDIDKYYYFKLHNGTEYAVKVTAIRINTAIMTMYRELTDEQREFYIAHPTASIHEIVQAHLDPPYVPPTPDVREYAAQKVKELKEACYASVTVTSLEYAMAEDKVNNLTADSYYTALQANNVLKNFRSQSKKAMQVFDTYRPQILAASTIEAIDTLYNQAINAL